MLSKGYGRRMVAAIREEIKWEEAVSISSREASLMSLNEYTRDYEPSISDKLDKSPYFDGDILAA